jgi:hypothetical protein
MSPMESGTIGHLGSHCYDRFTPHCLRGLGDGAIVSQIVVVETRQIEPENRPFPQHARWLAGSASDATGGRRASGGGGAAGEPAM